MPQGATTAPPPTKEEIEKLLAAAPKYGIEIRLPKFDTHIFDIANESEPEKPLRHS